MIKYISKRILTIIPIIIGLSLLMFLLSRFMPGDPVRLKLGPDASASQIYALQEKLGLHKPIIIQYFNYLTGIFRGDLGMSIRTGRNVAVDIAETFPATFELVVFAVLIATAVGIPLGVISSTRYNKWPDFVIRIFSMSGIAIPGFLLAILLQLIFGYWLGIAPIIGRGDMLPQKVTGLNLLDSLLTGNGAALTDCLKHIILPAVSLSIATCAQIMRITRSNMLSQLKKDYILAAKSYGLPGNIVENRYMLKNAFTSVLTIIGMEFGSLIGNAFTIETVYGWPGMAEYSIKGLMYKDYNSIISVTLIVGLLFAVINIVVDIFYSAIDPRIKVGN